MKHFPPVNDIISSDITHKEKVRNLFSCGIFLCCKDVSRTSPKLGLRTKTVVWLFSLFEKLLFQLFSENFRYLIIINKNVEAVKILLCHFTD